MAVYTKTVSIVSGRMVVRKYPNLAIARCASSIEGSRATLKEENVKRCAAYLNKMPGRGMYHGVSAPIKGKGPIWRI